MDGHRSVGLTGDWDTRINRRTLLRTGGTAAAGLLLLGAATAQARPPWGDDPFSLGVASGDPTPDGMVLWTRLAPEPLAGGGMKPEVYEVRYEIAKDPLFFRIVRRGAVPALPNEVHSVHAEVAGLEPATRYWYRFKFGPDVSPVGRTRTAPAAGSSPERMRFAFVSCQNYTDGYFHAYADLAQQEDVELVVHLGDYIYEGPGLRADAVRPHVPARELMALDDYRARHAQYRTDPSLQAAHAATPWLMTWDDHEFEDNYANLTIDSDLPIEDVARRRAAAYLAYWEHAPLPRSRKPVGKDLNLFRRTAWGDLATFHVLDTRQYRDDQTACTPAQRDPASGYCPGQLDPERTILGAEQRAWLLDGLANGPVNGWNVLANQVGFAPQDGRLNDLRREFGYDSWDGYVADRQLILDLLHKQSLANTVVITGDKHRSSVRNVATDFHDLTGPPAATEFVGTSITSGSDIDPLPPIGRGNPDNPHILFEDVRRGYVRVDVERDAWRTDFRVVGSVRSPTVTPGSTLESWMVERGAPGAFPVTAAV